MRKFTETRPSDEAQANLHPAVCGAQDNAFTVF